MYNLLLLVVILLLLVEVALFHLLARLLLWSKLLFFGVSTAALHPSLLFFCVLDFFIRCHIEVLLSKFKDVEVADLPLFDVQFNDAVLTKMSFQNWQCHTFGVDVSWTVV